MNVRIITSKLAAAVLGGAVLAGIGCGAALAATPSAAHSVRPASQPASRQVKGGSEEDSYSVTNRTPYTWTLLAHESMYYDGKWEPIGFPADPPQSVLPGQTATWAVWYRGVFAGDASGFVGYSFTDVNAGQHRVQVNNDKNANLVSYAYDYDTDPAKVRDSTSFHMTWDADDNPRHVDAVLNQPAEVTIDAATDPNRAAQVMTQFPNGTNQSYTALGTPSWTETNPVRGSARLINASSAPATLVAATGTTNSESTSLSVELSWKTTLNILGFANTSIGASIESGHSWATSTEVADGNSVIVDPGKMGWFTKTNQLESVTGNFSFTNPDGIIYHVNNVTVSMPGLSKPGQGIPTPGTAFTPTFATVPALPPIGK